MELLAYKFLLTGEIMIVAIAFVAIIAGFLPGLFFFRNSTAEIRRMTYFMLSGILYLVISMTGLIWAYQVEAMRNDQLWVLVLFSHVLCIIFGVIVAYVAMARSRNAFGDTWRAFFTLIPFLNLVLLFSKPHEGGPADIRSRAQKIVYNVFGLFVGFTALGAAKSLEATIEKQANRNLEIIMADPALAAKQEMMFMEAAGIEEFLRLAEKNTEMPIQVDELTKMVKITAEGETLKRTFIISTEMEMNDAVRAFIKESTCNEPMLVKMLSMGGSLEEIYTQEDGRMIGSTIVTIADCPVI